MSKPEGFSCLKSAAGWEKLIENRQIEKSVIDG
jgi:hypothetical protein